MSLAGNRILFWAPRALAVAYIVFISLFALDVFNEKLSWARLVLALGIHLLPSLVLVAVLALAWRWEWIGAGFYGLAAVWYAVTVERLRMPQAMKLTWILGIAAPAFLVAVLFLMNWIKRGELHAGRA